MQIEKVKVVEQQKYGISKNAFLLLMLVRSNCDQD